MPIISPLALSCGDVVPLTFLSSNSISSYGRPISSLGDETGPDIVGRLLKAKKKFITMPKINFWYINIASR